MRRISVLAACLLGLAACSSGGGDSGPPPTQPSLSLFAGTLGGEGSVDGPVAIARFRSPAGLARDAAGNLYATDEWSHTIRRISADGIVTTLAGVPGVPGYANAIGSIGRFNYPHAIAIDGAGTLYVADTGNRAVRKITANGAVDTLYQGIDARGLAIARDGTLLATEGHAIVRIGANGVKSVVVGVPGEAGTVDGPRELARLNQPTGLEVDEAGNVYFTSLDHTVRRMAAAGDVKTIAGAAGQPGVQDGAGVAARFEYPWGITRDPQGNLYLVSNNAVRKVAPSGEVTTLAGQSDLPGTADGTGAAARFSFARDILFDGGGNLFVAETYRIRKVTLAGVVTTYAGTAPVEGPRFVDDVTVALDGTVYSISHSDHIVSRIGSDGSVTVLAGVAGSAGHVDGLGSAARFDRLNGIATDSAGNVYVSDVAAPCFLCPAAKVPPPTYYGTIRRVTPAGEVTTIAGSASEGGTVDGPAAVARFRDVAGLAIDAQGNIYVTDRESRTLRRISAAGVVSTLAGTNSFIPQHLDGMGTAARFMFPFDVALGSDGNLLVADGPTIRKVTPDGQVTTVAGSTAAPFDLVDGPGTSARFLGARSIAGDGAGNFYVGEEFTGVIRKLDAGGFVRTVAGQRYILGFAPGPLPGALQYPSGLAVHGTDLYIAMGTAVAVVRNRP